jgi:hypothetical protein
MARFTFSRQLFKQQPNKRHYNEVINDFKRVVNGGRLTADNLEDEAIRFRHLKGPTSILLYKDCADDIFRFGSGTVTALAPRLTHIGRFGSFDIYKTGETDALNTAKLWYTPPSPNDAKIIDFTIEYYPYNGSPHTEICPAIQPVGSTGWIALTDYSKKLGLIAGQSSVLDYTPYKALSDQYPHHPVLTSLGVATRSTGNPRTDKLHTGAIPQCVRLNMQIGKEISNDGSTYRTDEIQAYGMAIRHDVATDVEPHVQSSLIDGYADYVHFRSSCSRFDHLNLIIVARKF